MPIKAKLQAISITYPRSKTVSSKGSLFLDHCERLRNIGRGGNRGEVRRVVLQFGDWDDLRSEEEIKK